ncbi:hypothetical protein IAQ61_007268 [Plenodomus lingam]|uniref:uncharacterized protein n=1 Tax=Leptosphaeria maculans TaxID=5022 RepID=UPI00332F3A42|nr:hypothetical protein IAQ61_007268 [Plenodomus lingam]
MLRASHGLSSSHPEVLSHARALTAAYSYHCYYQTTFVLSSSFTEAYPLAPLSLRLWSCLLRPPSHGL